MLIVTESLAVAKFSQKMTYECVTEIQIFNLTYSKILHTVSSMTKKTIQSSVFISSWRTHRNIEYPVWIQYHPDGFWVYCIVRPNRCKYLQGHSYDDFDDKWEGKETFYNFQIGPTHIVYATNSYTTSTQNHVVLSNVWFVEEAIDLVKFSGKLNYQTLD